MIAILCVLLLLLATPAAAEEMRTSLVHANPGTHGRQPLHTDPIELAMILGEWQFPEESDAWQALNANEDGWVEHELGGGAYHAWAVESDVEKVVLLEAGGHRVVYVNGEPRVGNVYGYDYYRIPVLLKQGRNEFLFQDRQGRLRARLVEPPADLSINPGDATLPDLILEQDYEGWGAVVVINATREAVRDLTLTAGILDSEGGGTITTLPTIPPMSLRKVPFELSVGAMSDTMPRTLQLELSSGHVQAFELRVREPQQTRKITYLSNLDGSVQYYALNPMSDPTTEDPALFLTCHGASVEAIGQADAYGPKSWGHIVAPTNRRPYGFDWEEIGARDAIEAMWHARETLGTEFFRTYLTGHSMGGHGAWYLGALYPGMWGVIAPSAGWQDFWTYSAEAPVYTTEAGKLLDRASNISRLSLFATNYLDTPIYILHGDADDNVPPSEAEGMIALLDSIGHTDYQVHMEPGAGHWWDNSEEPGAACVDWPGFFELFAAHEVPRAEAMLTVDFTTVNPRESFEMGWVEVIAQERALLPSRVQLHADPATKTIGGTTENVRSLRLTNAGPLELGTWTLELDGQLLSYTFPPDNDFGPLLERREGRWQTPTHFWDWMGSDASEGRNYLQAGPLRQVFSDPFVLVYGTHGRAEENAWAANRARLDAETWWYRVNGRCDVVPDAEYLANRWDAYPTHNVVLYGNADTNSVFAALLPHAPVQLESGRISAGDVVYTEPGLAALYCYPGDGPLVGVVGGVDLLGMKLTDQLPYLMPGVHYPDLTILSPRMLTHGEEGLIGAGFFGPDWSIENGEFAFAPVLVHQTPEPVGEPIEGHDEEDDDEGE